MDELQKYIHSTPQKLSPVGIGKNSSKWKESLDDIHKNVVRRVIHSFRTEDSKTRHRTTIFKLTVIFERRLNFS